MVNRLRNSRDKERKKGFVYRERDARSVKERSEQTGNNFDSIFKTGIDSWRPAQGDNNIRILPPTFEDAEHYGFDIWVHSWVGPDRSTYLCPKKMLGKVCPICEEAKLSRDAGEEEEAKALEPRKNTIAWIIDRDGDSDTPAVYQMSWTIDRDIAALCLNKKTGKVLQIDHPNEGYDLSFVRKGTGLKTKYFGFQIDRDPSPIMDKEKDQDEVIAYIEDNPLPDVLKYYDEDYLRKMIEGTAEAKDDDDDEKGSRRGRGKKDDDDDDRGSRRGRGSKDDDDDDKNSRRGRGRDKDDEKEDDRGSRRRGRDADDDDNGGKDDDRGSRRGRAAEPEDDEKPRGRVRVQPADDKDDDKDDDRGSRRGRGSKDDEADDDRSSRRRGRGDDDDRGSRRRGDDDDEPERGSRRRGRDDDNEGDDKDGDEGDETGDDREDEGSSRRGGRRGSKDDDADEDRGSRRGRGSKDDDDDSGSRRRR